MFGGKGFGEFHNSGATDAGFGVGVAAVAVAAAAAAAVGAVVVEEILRCWAGLELHRKSSAPPGHKGQKKLSPVDADRY